MTESGLAKLTLGCRAVGGWNRAPDANPASVSGIKHSPRDPQCWPKCSRATGTRSCSPGSLGPHPRSRLHLRWSGRRWARRDWVQCFSIEKAGAVEVPGGLRCLPGDCRFRVCTVQQALDITPVCSTGPPLPDDQSCQPRLSVAIPEVVPPHHLPPPFPWAPALSCYMPSSCQSLPSASRLVLMAMLCPPLSAHSWHWWLVCGEFTGV